MLSLLLLRMKRTRHTFILFFRAGGLHTKTAADYKSNNKIISGQFKRGNVYIKCQYFFPISLNIWPNMAFFQDRLYKYIFI